MTPGGAAALGERLRAIGLTAKLMRELPERHAALRDDAAALAVRVFRDGTPLTGIESGILFGDCPVPPADLRLDIVVGLYLFSAPEQILGPGAGTAILYYAARQVPAETLLDLGCGCGTLALLLRSPQVVATDVNPMALELTSWNAVVNGISGLTLHCGSLFTPVGRERFDLIVSQPPYIPIPAGGVAHPYYHGGARGDELVRAVLRDAPDHLTANGRALVFADFPLRCGETLRERVPHQHTRATVWRSPELDPTGYYAPQASGVRAVHNCLVMLEPGNGYREVEVLPHQWGRIDIQ